MDRPRYVSLTTVAHRVGSEVQQIYGGISVRYWLGDPGESHLISGSALMWEPIRLEDKQGFEDEIKLALRQEVSRRLELEMGLIVPPDQIEPLEWLIIWTAELDTMQRVRAFERGMSRVFQGRRPQDLKAADLGRLARITGAMPRRPETEKHNPE